MGKLAPSSGSLRSFDSRPGGALGQGSSFSLGSNQLLGVLVLSNIAFNLTDVATTLFALGKGLQEGNTLVLGMSAALGLNIFSSLVILKILFMAGALVVALVGVKNRKTNGGLLPPGVRVALLRRVAEQPLLDTGLRGGSRLHPAPAVSTWSMINLQSIG